MVDTCTPVVKPDDVRDLGSVEIGALRKLVERVSDPAWAHLDEGKENDFFCFHHTKHIIFRFIPSNRDPAEAYATPAWAIWQPFLMPIMNEVTRHYDYPDPAIPKAMLARLEAGQIIDRHVDGAGSNLVTHKIHVPIITNPGALFIVNDQAFHLEAGRAYEVNNIVPHAAQNDGDEDRIHLIFEIWGGAE